MAKRYVVSSSKEGFKKKLNGFTSLFTLGRVKNGHLYKGGSRLDPRRSTKKTSIFRLGGRH